MKRLFNDPRAVVREMLEGFADLTPGIALLDDGNVVVRANLPEPGQRKVPLSVAAAVATNRRTPAM